MGVSGRLTDVNWWLNWWLNKWVEGKVDGWRGVWVVGR